MTKKKSTPVALTPMAKLTADIQATPTLAVQLILWKQRHSNPDMSVLITEDDLQGFRACVDYLEVEPTLRCFQPGGRPERPAFKKKDGTEVPAQPAIPPREECVVQLTDKGGNAITPIERSSEEQAKGRQGREVQQIKSKVPGLVADLRQMSMRGETSSAMLEEACGALLIMARG